MARIVVKFNEAVLREIELAQSQLWIGRKPGNDVVIDNAAVSGEHARIIQEEGMFYVEDMASTNGTFLNDKRVHKQELYDGDRVRIGKHLLIYQDETRKPPPPAPPSHHPALPKAFDAEKTMILDTPKQRELLKGEQGAGAAPKLQEKLGALRIVSGNTDRKEYDLVGRLTIIGSEHNAGVKLTGWFAPKVAALISRKPEGYSLSMSEAKKPILLNGTPIRGRSELKDGDLVEVAGVKMCFYLKE